MKAKLVTFTFCTRVVVPDNFNEEQIERAAVANMVIRLNADTYSEFMTNCTAIEDDKECPYNQHHDKKGQFGVYKEPVQYIDLNAGS